MKTLLISSILLLFFLCSCSTAKKLPVKDYTKLDETNINLVNGSYILKDSIDYIFWLEILGTYNWNKGNIVVGDKLVVQIIDKNYFKVKLLKQNLILYEKEFRSKLKRGYINFRNRKITGYPPLAWGVISSNNLMYLSKNGLRMMQYRSNSSFFFFFFPFNSVSWEENMLFQKID